jgi:hypothetical protein
MPRSFSATRIANVPSAAPFGCGQHEPSTTKGIAVGPRTQSIEASGRWPRPPRYTSRWLCGAATAARRARFAACRARVASLLRESAAVLLLPFLFGGAVDAAPLQVRALGGTLEVFEIPDGVLTSALGEERIAFLKRVGAALHEYTKRTGFEACGKIWSRGARLAVRCTSNHSHVGCVVTDLAPSGDGWTADADGIHSHPIDPYYRTNEADALFQGHVASVGTRAHTDGAGFSQRDFGLSRGYLVNSEGRLLHQQGRETVQDLGLLELPEER